MTEWHLTHGLASFSEDARIDTSRPATRLARGAGVVAWAFLIIVYAVVAASWLWEYDLERSSRLYDDAALGTFLVRILGVHIAIGGIAVAVAALAAGRWRYAVACLPVIAFLLAPLFARADSPRTPARDEDAIVLMSINLRRGADGEAHLLRQVDKVDPDILVLQEWTTTWDDAIGEQLRDRYDSEFSVARPDPQGIATYSKLRASRAAEVQLGRFEYPALISTFALGNGEFTLYNVHLPMPLSLAAHAEQRRQVSNLARRVKREDEPVVVVGDFNHTETTQHHAHLLDAGLRSAWSELRNGRGVTWSRLGRVQGRIPGLRLDHVLASSDVELLEIRLGDRGASDHWPVIAELQLSER